ncbi:MAG: class I SAM-dependent methyltransferase [Balneolaceae bacterium]|nr:class I SAM-dependent methyltransferase [Balneolaceae bacterium]
MENKDTPIYTILAALYDSLMGDVDYEAWADFIDEIIQTHHPNPIDVMELACGTGSLVLSLAELECYNLTGTDQSQAMVDIARKKSNKQDAGINFEVQNFLHLEMDATFDAIFSVFDSVNYLHNPEEILTMLENCWKVLNPWGILIFDFSTPKNSLEAENYLNNDKGSAGNLRYFRESKYDPEQKFHYNLFKIEEVEQDGKTVLERYKETHKQRIYTLDEMLSIVKESSYHLIAKYEDFDLIDADENSTRVTMVLQCRKQQ